MKDKMTERSQVLDIIASIDKAPQFSCSWITGASSVFQEYWTDNEIEFTPAYGPRLLYVHNINIFRDTLKIKKRDILNFEFRVKNTIIESFEAEILADLLVSNNGGNAFIFSSVFRTINEPLVILINSWCGNQSAFDWRNLEGGVSKTTWLRACFIWSRINDTGAPNSCLEIDNKFISEEEDIFCMLGESAFGKRGYLGQDLDGLHERLGIMIAASSSPITLSIRDSKKLKEKLSVWRGDDYFDEFLQVFNDNKVLVRLL